MFICPEQILNGFYSLTVQVKELAFLSFKHISSSSVSVMCLKTLWSREI